jgi:hypothetical protein
MKISQSVLAVDASSAWSELIAMGWSLYVSEKSLRGYAMCQRCSVTPRSFDDALETVTRKRKRR